MNLWLLLTTLTSPDWTMFVFLTDCFISKQTDTAVMLLVKDNTATNVLSSSRVISCLTGSTLVLTKTRSTSSPSQSVSNKETPLSRGIRRPVYIAHNSFPIMLKQKFMKYCPIRKRSLSRSSQSCSQGPFLVLHWEDHGNKVEKAARVKYFVSSGTQEELRI